MTVKMSEEYKIESREDAKRALREIEENSREVRRLLKEARFHRERAMKLLGLSPEPYRFSFEDEDGGDRAAA